MINLSYTVAGQLIEPASVPQYLVADTVGVYQVAFTFDADWADMGEKTVVFRNPQVIDPDYRDVPVEFPLDANGQALVPAALLDPGKLFIGVYGTNSTQQFPTIWAPPLQVVPGASPGVEPSDDPALGTVIRTIPQTLTEEEKAQARANIGANEIEGGTAGNVVIIDNNLNIEDSGLSKNDVLMSPQLTSHIYAEDQTPYLYRQTGGGVEAGTREYDSIVGGSIVWNQKLQNPTMDATLGGWVGRSSSVSLANNVATATPTSAGTGRGLTGTQNGINTFPYKAGHMLLMEIDVNCPISTNITFSLSGANGVSRSISANAWTRLSCIWTYTNDIAHGAFYALVSGSLTTSQSVQYKNAFACDLTEMFGTAVADRLYAMETASQGSAIAILKRMFPEDTYAYTAEPSLLSSMPTAHKTVGFNRFDKTKVSAGKWLSTTTGLEETSRSYTVTDYIRVFGGAPVYIPDTDSARRWFYSMDKTQVQYLAQSSAQIFTPPTDGYIRASIHTFGSGAKNLDEICINISDPTRNGQYEPYTEHTYPLSGIELRGVPAVDSAGGIYFEGDTYAPDGTVTRRYGTITLTGDEAWNTVNTGLVGVELSGMMPAPAGGAGNPHGRAAGYVTCDAFADVRAVYSNTYDKAAVFGSGYIGSTSRLYIRDNANAPSVDDWKSYLSTHPLTVVYELATPTIETATPYDALQICDPLGTEEYVDERTVPVPVGHVTKYPVDQVRKLDGLPSDFSTLIAPTEKEFKASATRTTGFKFIYQNQLYKCIANVASGAAYTIGTNVKKTTIAEELDLLS